MTMKKKPKAAVGNRYDVILTDGGNRTIEAARVVKEITGRRMAARSRRRVEQLMGADLPGYATRLTC